MVSALDLGVNGLGLSPSWGIVLSSWASHFTLTVSLSNQVCEWVVANSMLEGNPAVD